MFLVLWQKFIADATVCQHRLTGVHQLLFICKMCSLLFLSLQAHTREPLPEPMSARLYNGMKSIDLPGKSAGLSEQITKEQFVIFMSNLLKGNADEKISIIMRMIAKTGGPLKGKQIQEVNEQLNVSWGDSGEHGYG